MTRQKAKQQIGLSRLHPVDQSVGVRRVVLAAGVRAAKKTASAKVHAASPARDPERSELQRKLVAAEARVKELDGRLAAMTDRIAWIVDRLHSLTEDGD